MAPARDARYGIQRKGAGASRETTPITVRPRVGNVCRHDIAAAARAAVLPPVDINPMEVLHVATVDLSLPANKRASAVCNVRGPLRYSTILGPVKTILVHGLAM